MEDFASSTITKKKREGQARGEETSSDMRGEAQKTTTNKGYLRREQKHGREGEGGWNIIVLHCQPRRKVLDPKGKRHNDLCMM